MTTRPPERWTPEPPVPSPCVNVCRMNPVSGTCEGCERTLEEITVWATASNEDRRGILLAVQARRSARGTTS